MVFGIASKLAGKLINKNEFEAIVAASVLMAAANGKIDTEEMEQTKISLSQNDNLSAFTPVDIARKLEEYKDKLALGMRSGKLALKKEILDIAGNAETAEKVYVVALDVAGEMDKDEIKFAHELAGWLGLNPAAYDVPAISA